MTFLKWRVERAGTATGGYFDGWIAMNPDATRGAVFATHAEAVEFATRQAQLEDQDAKRALIKLAATRGVQAAGGPGRHKRRYRRVSQDEIDRARELRADNRSWREVAEELGVNSSTIMLAVKRAEQSA